MLPTVATSYGTTAVAALCELDLASVHRWIRQGHLTAVRTPGGHLRLRRDDVLDFLRRHEFPVPPELTAGLLRVVAVDADAAWRGEIAAMLRRSFEVTAYADPLDALLAIGRDHPDGVVLDTTGDALDLSRLVRVLRARDDLHHTRIVVFSNATPTPVGADPRLVGYVAKPRVTELHHVLRRMLGVR